MLFNQYRKISSFSYKTKFFINTNKKDLIFIVALSNNNNNKNLPSLGGCRFIQDNNIFDNLNKYLNIVGNLSQSMQNKSSIHNLPFAGGKSIILSKRKKSRDILEKYGKYLNTFIKEKYIVAVDININQQDLDIISIFNKYVVNTTKLGGDPSYYTAQGVFLSIKKSINLILNKNLKNKKILIQGAGKVGTILIKKLIEEKAEVFVDEIDDNKKKISNVNFIDKKNISSIKFDVFSPCASGNILNNDIIIDTNIICGAANDQILDYNDIVALHKKKIFFAPDFLINAGGLIYCAKQILNIADYKKKINNIPLMLYNIYKISCNKNIPAYFIAKDIAMKK